MSFWDFDWIQGAKDQSPWSKGLGLFGSAMSDIGAGVSGRPDLMGHMRAFADEQKNRRSQSDMLALIDRFQKSRQPVTGAPGEQVPGQKPMSFEDLVLEAARVKAQGGDPTALFALAEATKPADRRYFQADNDILRTRDDGGIDVAYRGRPPAPLGYAYQADGSLAFIKGGPADPRAARYSAERVRPRTAGPAKVEDEDAPAYHHLFPQSQPDWDAADIFHYDPEGRRIP